MLLVLRYVLMALTAAARERRALALENIALRHQVEVLMRSRRRPDLRPADRLLWSWLSRTWPDWRRHVVIVRTFYVFFVISHDRRRIMHWNVTAHPTAPWVWRQIVAATPWNTAPRSLIRDRDRNYGGDFVPKAAAIGIETVLTPVRSPKANAIAERVIGTIGRDCLDHLTVLTERHLRRVLRDYVSYYNDTRPHQSLGDQPPSGPRPPALRGATQRLASRPILGGLHHEYFWEAA